MAKILSIIILTLTSLLQANNAGIFGSFFPYQPKTVLFESGQLIINGEQFESLYSGELLPSETVTLNDKETLVFISPNEESMNNVRMEVTIGDKTAVNPFLYAIAGPATIRFTPTTDDVYWIGGNQYEAYYNGGGVSYFIINSDNQTSGDQSSIVSIPGLDGSTFRVEMQESTNLVDWLTALPGDKTADATPKFYRLVVTPQE